MRFCANTLSEDSMTSPMCKCANRTSSLQLGKDCQHIAAQYMLLPVKMKIILILYRLWNTWVLIPLVISFPVANLAQLIE